MDAGLVPKAVQFLYLFISTVEMMCSSLQAVQLCRDAADCVVCILERINIGTATARWRFISAIGKAG